MASNLDMQEEELACPICFEEFDRYNEHRLPKLLMCFHTFCYDCIKALRKIDGTINCSICRTTHNVKDLSELYDNYVIHNYLRAKQELEDEKLACKLSEEYEEQARRHNSDIPDTSTNASDEESSSEPSSRNEEIAEVLPSAPPDILAPLELSIIEISSTEDSPSPTPEPDESVIVCEPPEEDTSIASYHADDDGSSSEDLDDDSSDEGSIRTSEPELSQDESATPANATDASEEQDSCLVSDHSDVVVERSSRVNENPSKDRFSISHCHKNIENESDDWLTDEEDVEERRGSFNSESNSHSYRYAQHTNNANKSYGPVRAHHHEDCCVQ